MIFLNCFFQSNQKKKPICTFFIFLASGKISTQKFSLMPIQNPPPPQDQLSPSPPPLPPSRRSAASHVSRSHQEEQPSSSPPPLPPSRRTAGSLPPLSTNQAQQNQPFARASLPPIPNQTPLRGSNLSARSSTRPEFESVDSEDVVVDSFQTPSHNYKLEHEAKSVSEDVVYVEIDKRFKKMTRKEFLTNCQNFNQENSLPTDSSSSSSQPPPPSSSASSYQVISHNNLDTLFYAKQVQSFFWILSLLSEGALSGVCSLQLLIIYQSASNSTATFLSQYENFSLSINSICFILTSFSLVFAIDNYFINRNYSVDSFRHVKFINHIILFFIYWIAFLLQLSITPFEEKIHLYSSNPSLWDQNSSSSTLSIWKSLCVVRFVSTTLGWLFVGIELRRHYEISKKVILENQKKTRVRSLDKKDTNVTNFPAQLPAPRKSLPENSSVP
eukprot:Sdes_comp20429_c0_seq1m14560